MKMPKIWCFNQWLPPCFDMLTGFKNGFLIVFYGSLSSYIFLIELLLISKDSIKNMGEYRLSNESKKALDLTPFLMQTLYYTANFYAMKTTGTENCRVLAGKTCTIYGKGL